MCFSPTASFIAGAALSAAGVETLRHAKTHSRAPFAAIPLIFGVQQLIEGIVWITFDRPVAHTIAIYAFVFFSHLFWPFYVPFAVWAMEPDPRRKRTLVFFFCFGLAISLNLLYHFLDGPVTASIVGRCIRYDTPVVQTLLSVGFYVAATVACCWYSSHAYVRLFGIAMFGSFLIAYISYNAAFYSVWCFFAAILSLIVYLHLRLPDPAASMRKAADRYLARRKTT